MTGSNDPQTPDPPSSPEAQPPYVREELHQDQIDHEGDYREAEAPDPEDAGMRLGAVEDEVVPVIPPMAGPADLVGEHDENGEGNETGDTEVGEEMIDPRDELTPG